MIAQATFGILLLVSLGLCFAAAKRWHWSHVFLGEVLFLSSLLFALLAGDVLRLNQESRDRFKSLQRRLGEQQPLARAIVHGTRDSGRIGALQGLGVPVVMDPNPDNPDAMQGVLELDHRLGMIAGVVGRKWDDARPQGAPDPQTLAVTVRVEFPQPHGIEEDAILYVFEAGEPARPDPTQGPQYLGEFRVGRSAGEAISIEPVGTMDEFEQRRLANSVGPWVLYESMPVDQYPNGLLRLFADVANDDFGQYVPESVVEEYARHGGPDDIDDEDVRLLGLDADGNVVSVGRSPDAVRYIYNRRLRDYSFEFLQMSKRWIELRADRDLLTEDNKKLQAALLSARQLQAFREDEQRRLNIDLAGMTRDREAIEAHLGAVTQSLENARQLLASTLAENLQMAADLAAFQQAAIEGANAISGAAAEL